jgi:hypothetical protein
MGIDHVIDLDCVPKQTLTTPGILARLKAQQRAATIIKLYRDRGDNRPPSEMGFEMVRRTPDGNEEVQVVVVQELLDEAVKLEPLANYCEGCPANRAGRAFGCFDNINYPLTRIGEIWLLKQLPKPDDTLIFLLLQQTVQDIQEKQSDQVGLMRQNPGSIFETRDAFARRYHEFSITTDQVFQMLFFPDSIQPAYAALLLLLFGAISRELTPQQMMDLTSGPPAEPIPFIIEPEPTDDETTYALKKFFESIHRAFHLNVSVSLDA